jgi:hypothetical protein
MARHAEMFDKSCPLPCEVSVPSFRRTTVGCCRGSKKVSHKFTGTGVATHHRQTALHSFGLSAQHTCERKMGYPKKGNLVMVRAGLVSISPDASR